MATKTPSTTLSNTKAASAFPKPRVQPAGALIAVASDWSITHISQNCAKILGLDQLPKPGDALSSVFSRDTMELLRNTLINRTQADGIGRLSELSVTANGPKMDCTIHRSGKALIIEIERSTHEGIGRGSGELTSSLAHLASIEDATSLCEEAARIAREHFGFDRVLVYKFHPDTSSEIIAENYHTDLAAHYGLRQPIEDHAKQIRGFLQRNRVRFVADTQARLVMIDDAKEGAPIPLVLSSSSLRAPPLSQLKYLRQMGIRASLCLAITRETRLWGMIACYHHEPRIVPHPKRGDAELFSQMFSVMLDRALTNRSHKLNLRSRALHEQLMVRLAGGSSLANSLPIIRDILIGSIEHSGLSILLNGEYNAVGSAPSESEFNAVLPDLSQRADGEAFATNDLAEMSLDAVRFANEAAGALVLPISRDPRDYLVLWRRPLTSSDIWEREPSRTNHMAAGLWKDGTSARWSEDDIAVAETLRITLIEVALRMSDEITRQRKRSQEQQELLIAELNHRVRNILNLIRSLVSQTQDDALSVSTFAKLIGGRISALASAHDNITRENWSPAPLSELFETEIAAYVSNKGNCFTYEGPEFLINPEAYTGIALVVHELVTNAAKYGSLCDNSGSVLVKASQNQAGDLEIAWRESGGPPVKEPTQRGFGSTIIERSIPFELGGKSQMRFVETGLEADFVVPSRLVEQLAPANSGGDGRPATSRPCRNPKERGSMPGNEDDLPQNVLVVEDSMLIALDTEQNLTRLGVGAVRVAGNVAGALKALEDDRPDFAILDFNLGEEDCIPVACALRDHGIRFVIATGFSDVADDYSSLGAEALICKPYGRDDIEAMLRPAILNDVLEARDSDPVG